MATRRPGVAVGHVDGALLVRDRDKLDARRRKDVEGIHERRADDPENVADAVGGESFDQGL
jgi:hypothetical protein